MTNNQKIQEFEKVMDKGFIDYFGSQTGGFVPKHYKERFKSFLLSALEQKDTEKERALKEQMDNFLNQDANQHDQMVREKALEDYKVGLMKKLDDILTLLK